MMKKKNIMDISNNDSDNSNKLMKKNQTIMKQIKKKNIFKMIQQMKKIKNNFIKLFDDELIIKEGSDFKNDNNVSSNVRFKKPLFDRLNESKYINKNNITNLKPNKIYSKKRKNDYLKDEDFDEESYIYDKNSINLKPKKKGQK